MYNSEKQRIEISDLYPELSEKQQAEAAHCLARYIELVHKIFERINNLTESDGPPTMGMH